MASVDVVVFTDDNFQSEVLGSKDPVLVDFWAAWCGPCRAIAPLVDQLAAEYKGKLKVGKLDVDAHQNVPQKYDVMSIPTLLLFKNGQVADRVVGAVPKSKLDAMVKQALGGRRSRRLHVQADPDGRGVLRARERRADAQAGDGAEE